MYKSNPSKKNYDGIYISKVMLFAVILPIVCAVLVGIGFLIVYLTTPVESMIMQQTQEATQAASTTDTVNTESELTSSSTESSDSIEQNKPALKPQEQQEEPEVTEQPQETSDVEQENDDEEKDSSSYGRLSRTENAGRGYYESLYYFGGLEIANLALFTAIPDDHVISNDKGFSPDTALEDKLFKIDGTYLTGPQAVQYYKPRALVMCFGRNGGTYMSVTTFKNYYRKLIVEIQDRVPNTQIIIMSVFPVTLAYERSEEDITRDEEFGAYDNEKIVEMNAALQDLAKELRVYYLAADGVLRYNDLQASPLHPDYCHTDGVLLNRTANEKVEDYIREHKLPNY